ncbi:MAG: class I SAM-dependent methyltransferase [Patescibacteria group bacterium]|nr:class I SAM-dependent methyltransferase [Patescibacteria group bacterium]
MPKANSLVFPQDVDGWLWKEEGEILYRLAQLNKDLGVIVELGSYKGKSTICLAQGSKKVSGGKVYALDNFIGDSYVGIKKTSFYNQFLLNIEKYFLKEYVESVKGDFSEAVKSWNKPIRLLFIDGSHNHEDVKRDFENWEPKVAHGGIIVFHDALVWPGVSKFVRQIIASGEFSNIKIIETYAGIVHLTKPRNGKKMSISATKKSISEFDRLLKAKNIKRRLLTIREKVFIRG